MRLAQLIGSTVLLLSLLLSAPGCEYEDEDPALAELARQQELAAQQEQARQSSTGGFGYDGGGQNSSALAGARGAAQSIVAQAEQASQNVANQADQLDH